MWQSTYAKKKALRRQQQKKSARPKPFNLTLKRVVAEIKVLGDGNDLMEAMTESILVPARVMLNEFSSRGISLYGARQILVGQEVAVTIERPKRFYCKGRVISCQLQESKIICEHPYNYRMNVEFIFQSDAERQAVENFCQELWEEHLKKKKNRQQAANASIKKNDDGSGSAAA